MGTEPKTICSSSPIFEDFVNTDWITQRRAEKASWERDARMAKQRLFPWFGGMRIDQIGPDCVGDWLKSEQLAQCSANSRNRWLMVLKSIFKLAVERGLIPRSPADEARAEKITPKVVIMPPAEKIEQTLAWLKKEGTLRALALLLIMLTGADKTKILRARWENVNLEGGFMLLETAKPGRMRKIWLSPEAIAVIESLPHTDSPWLFPGENPSRPIGDIYRIWNRARKELGLENLRICDLARLYAGWRLKSGENLPYFRFTQGEQIFRYLRKNTLKEVPV